MAGARRLEEEGVGGASSLGKEALTALGSMGEKGVGGTGSIGKEWCQVEA